MRGTSPGKDILGKLAGDGGPVSIPDLFDEIRAAYGVDNIVYHATNVRGLTRDGAFLRLTYAQEWVDRYLGEDYFSIDPVVEEGLRSFMPYDWSELDWSSKQRREFAEDAEAHGVGTSGLTVPIRGPDGQHALFTVATTRPADEWAKQVGEQITELHTLAHHVHQTILLNEGASAPRITATLSVRERGVLQWAAAGKTNEEIAIILGIAERTVRVYFDTARHKLNATNRTHAVARAMSLGLIHPPE